MARFHKWTDRTAKVKLHKLSKNREINGENKKLVGNSKKEIQLLDAILPFEL